MKTYIILFLWIQGVVFAKSPIVFYHIPKSAGSTVAFLLSDRFSKQEVCPYFYYYQIENESIEELKKYSYFQGHFFLARIFLRYKMQ